MMKYSIAIRTLGTSLDSLKAELISLHAQTLPPDKIKIYIAEGYSIPDFRIGIEEYVYVNKGMVSQRALRYDDIDSEYILLLDDDVELSPDSAEKLLVQLARAEADCMAADTFLNHEMSLLQKMKYTVGNWVFPRLGQKWAFKLHGTGSFSYINFPKKDYYPSQSAAGPASMWKKESLLSLLLEDEKWLDELGFAFGDDELEFYKLHVNGGKLFVSFNHGIRNLDSKSASGAFQANKKKFYNRVYANTIRWHRIHYSTQSNTWNKSKNFIAYTSKLAWHGLIHLGISIVKLDLEIGKYYFKGIVDSVSFIKSGKYRNLPSYKFR